MNADQLTSIQAPLKQQYKDDPNAAVVTLSAEGHATGLSCKVATGNGVVLQTLRQPPPISVA